MDYVQKRLKEIFNGKLCNRCNDPAERLTTNDKITLFWCQQCYLDYSGREEIEYSRHIYKMPMPIEEDDDEKENIAPWMLDENTPISKVLKPQRSKRCNTKSQYRKEKKG